MHLLLQSRLKAFCESVISSKNRNYKIKKKWFVQAFIQYTFTRKRYLSISTSDGSKIRRVYAVACQGNSDCKLFLNQISTVHAIDAELKTGKV